MGRWMVSARLPKGRGAPRLAGTYDSQDVAVQVAFER
jgi:hypothetical protein